MAIKKFRQPNYDKLEIIFVCKGFYVLKDMRVMRSQKLFQFTYILYNEYKTVF